MGRTTNKELMNMMEQMMAELKEVKANQVALKTEQDSLKAEVSLIKKGQTSTKSNTKKKSTQKDAPSEKATKFATRKEAIEDWCQKKGYSEADRKAYGEAKRAERELQKKAYEMTNAQFTERVEYKVWKAQYEANLVALKAAK